MNTRFAIRRAATSVLLIGLGLATAAVAQQKPATVHGHAQNPVGQPIVGATVYATPTGNPSDAKASAVTDANGDYKIENMPTGPFGFVIQDPAQKGTSKVIDQTDQPTTIESGSDTTVDFDLTRPAFIAKLSPEERKKIEDFKAKNATVKNENAKRSTLNAVLKQERDARAAKHYDQAIVLANQITGGLPDEAVGWLELGIDQFQQGKYADAVPNLKKAIELNAASKKPTPEIARVGNMYLGDSQIMSGQYANAMPAYDAAAAADPTKAAGVYEGGATRAYNKNQTELTAQLADKAIAADPKDAMAYYLKGQALIQKASADKNGKIVTPPGCVESYQKYLELDPNGPHAAEVAQILEGVGAKVSSSYHAGKK